MRIIDNPKDVDFSTLESILKEFGFIRKQPGGGGSHYVFRKKGCFPICVPKNQPVKEKYVKDVIKNLNLETWYEEEC